MEKQQPVRRLGRLRSLAVSGAVLDPAVRRRPCSTPGTRYRTWQSTPISFGS
jgi:hypothetical protein